MVTGESLDAGVLQALRAEDDHGTITVNGEVIEIEKQNFTGTNGNDNITGTSGNDTINPLRGQDTVDGGEGNDLLIVDYSSNTYNGTTATSGISSSISGNGLGGFSGSYFAYYDPSYNFDQVSFSNIERFQITGTLGNDDIRTGDGNDTLIGGTGNDTLTAGGGNDSINGGAGNDSIDGGAGNDTINAGAGNDIITGGTGINIIDGGAGIDTLVDANFATATTAFNITDTSTTTYSPIVLADGTSVSNIERFVNLTSGSGNDVINFSQRADNTFNTGSGNDTINSGFGRDTVDGGEGNDLLIVDYSSNTYNGTTATPGISSSISGNGLGGFSGSYFAYYDPSRLRREFTYHLSLPQGFSLISRAC